MPVYTWIYHPIRSEQWLPSCCICNDPIPLERSKTDEYGQAVHEECYVLKVCSKAEFLNNGESVLSRANRHGIHHPYNAAIAETWKSRTSREPAVFATLPRQEANRRDWLKRLWNAEVTAVLTLLVLTCWIAYSNRRPISLWKFSEPQSIAFDERAFFRHANTLSAKGTPNLQTTSLPMKDARHTRTRLPQFGENGVDYVKEDVTVRYFTHTPPRQPVSLGESKVAYIGADVTVRYFSTKPAGGSGTREDR